MPDDSNAIGDKVEEVKLEPERPLSNIETAFEEKNDQSIYATGKFDSTWRITYQWVRDDTMEHVMFCQTCEVYSNKKDRIFVKGDLMYFI